MRTVTIQEIVQAEESIQQFPWTDATNFSYREFVQFFHSRPFLSAHDVTVGAYMVYGWMPCGLRTFDLSNLNAVVQVVNRAKLGQSPSDDDMSLLHETINHSFVGPSKLLHFVNPALIAIWDSRVFHFIEGPDAPEEGVASLDNYSQYQQNVRDLIAEEYFQEVQDSMNRKIGYWVTPVRACEYVMYMNGLPNN